MRSNSGLKGLCGLSGLMIFLTKFRPDGLIHTISTLFGNEEVEGAVSGGGCLEVLGFDVVSGDLSAVNGSGLLFVRLLRASEKII